VAIKHTSTSIVLPLTQHAILETYRTLFFYFTENALYTCSNTR